jgi:hypothetical protein
MTIPVTILHRDYKAHKIEFSPTDLKFHVSGPEFDMYKAEYCTFASFDEARAKIDTETEAAVRLKAKNLKFSETIVTEDGEVKTITGINRGTATISGIETRYVYPNVEWIIASVRRYRQLIKEQETIHETLRGLQIASSRGYGRIDASDYPEKLLSLSKMINEKRELALANPPAEILSLNPTTQKEA